jgi:hypothetical protein
MTKAKRGDAIVIFVDLKQGAWRIAKAAKTEKGIVKHYRLPGDPQLYETRPGAMRVFTIGDAIRQSAARRLFDAGNPVIRDTHAEMCDLIVAA